MSSAMDWREENRLIEERRARERPLFRLKDPDCHEKIVKWIENKKKPAEEVVVVRTPKDYDKLENVIAALP